MNPSLLHSFYNIATHKPGAPALKSKQNGIYTSISFEQLKHRIEVFAHWIRKQNLSKERPIAILSENRPEWILTDLAVLLSGHFLAPLHMAFSEEQNLELLNKVQSEYLIVSNKIQLKKILKIKQRLLHIKKIILMDSINCTRHNQFTTFSEVMKQEAPPAETIAQYLDQLSPHLPASLVFTSGTTQMSKAVLLTHENFLSNVDDLWKLYPFKRYKNAFSILPLSHALERTCGYYALLFGGTCLAYPESADKLLQNIQEIKPEIIIAVPRFYEKIYERIQQMIDSSPGWKQNLFQSALNHAEHFFYKGGRRKPWVWLSFKILDFLVFRKIRKSFGGNIISFISGAAPLMTRIQKFFYFSGMPIFEGYGMSEASPVVSCNSFWANKPGTVGVPLESTEIKIASDRELLIRGKSITQGYFKNELANLEAYDAEGWLHTGDLAELDQDGYLKIIGRKKEVLVLSNGKKVIPTQIENLLTNDFYFQQAVLVGEAKNYVSALVVPSWKLLIKEFSLYPHQLFEIMDESMLPEIYSFLMKRINKTQRWHAQHEKVKKILLLRDECTIENGLLTSTYKIKRAKLIEKYQTQIHNVLYPSYLSRFTENKLSS